MLILTYMFKDSVKIGIITYKIGLLNRKNTLFRISIFIFFFHNFTKKPTNGNFSGCNSEREKPDPE
jgi:hypothetical protein